MSEKNVRSTKMSMSESALVEKARFWTEDLCREEQRSRAEFLGAMARVASRLRLPVGFLKRLVYAPPKSISAGRFLKLAAAYDECLQRQKYREERAAFEPNSALGKILARAADLVAGEEDEQAG